MDLNALQTTLREFAAEREWEPFHTPKNLSMALMVEAAELAEIFQWMTPEQSRAARSDLLLQEQVADEVADVLLYLVQMADHMGIDLKRAVGRKLLKNSKKHPPLRPGRPGFGLQTAAARAVQTHVLVDWENVQPTDEDIRSLVPEVTDLWLFHGPQQKGVAEKHASFADRATPVKIARQGKNALDFHLSFYMGYIAARHPDARFVVVSNDKGYAPMLDHAAELGFSARQTGFGKAAARKTAPAKKAAPAKKVAKPGQPAAKKAAPAKKTSASAVAVITDQPAAIDLTKATSHVVASLGKTASKPAKQAKLMAAIKSLLGESADEQAVYSVLTRLLASGKVAIDPKGSVRYALQPA